MTAGNAGAIRSASASGAEPPLQPPPRHVALIPDGNRRWAHNRGLPAPEGHRAGIERLEPVLRACFAGGASWVTFWWGSPANLRLRRAEEVSVIAGTLDTWLRQVAPRLAEETGAAVRVLGRWRDLCPSLAESVERAESASRTAPLRITVLMAYDGSEDLMQAADRLHGSGGSRAALRQALWTGDLPDVDLLVRTGGEPHLSAAFLLWQLAEARLEFPETLWPDFDGEQMVALITRFRALPRRHGR